MFGENQDNQPENDQIATLPKAATLPDDAKIAVHPEAASTQSEVTSCISSNMTVVGKIVVEGSVTVLRSGRRRAASFRRRDLRGSTSRGQHRCEGLGRRRSRKGHDPRDPCKAV
jgi:hypothetical protein